MEGHGIVLIPAGNLDGELGIKPERHIFTGSKAPWYEITGLAAAIRGISA